MGQQPSKPDGKDSSSLPGDKLQAYPSLGKSDTRESSKSFRGAIRSKIPGSSKSDSPRASLSNLDTTIDKSDAGSIKSATSGKSGRNSVASPGGETENESSGPEDQDSPEKTAERQAKADVPQPPPSPSQSASLGRGHSSIHQARQTGEVDHVSDEPPTGALHPSSNAQPKESILVKKEGLTVPRPDRSKSPKRSKSPMRPKSPRRSSSEVASSPGLGIGSINSLDLDDMINRLLDAGYAAKMTKAVCLKNAEITAVCLAVRELLLSQPSLIELTAPVKIVGDIHGQYTDLLRTFEMCGFPPNANYLFLGDYVDRGKKSLETILLLFCYKLKFPENFFLLRGNHESANVTRVYGFYDECKRRCNIKIWKTFIDAFNCLPIAAIVASKIFCVHGGLSPSLSHMDDIRQIVRPTDVPDYGLLNDLLWSDPADMDADWESNERGVSYCFGKKVIMDFLQRHDFDLVCRAHMVVEDGYEFFQDRILVTVFSAPNVRLVFWVRRSMLTMPSTAGSLTIGEQ